MLRFLALMFSLLLLLAIIGTGGAVYVFWHYGQSLPDYHQLAHYEPPITTRVYGGDGRLVAEYAVEKRAFLPIDAIPPRIKEAFLSAEDKNFYDHAGVDPIGIARAVVVNIRNKGMGADRRPVGASTITQQVAKNFLLTNEVSIARKIKEAILAFRIERAFSKDHILELYLNEIYLGMGNYGVAAAANSYFNRALDELTVAEAAYLAALPKAPNNYHPIRHAQAAKERRDWVIGRMLEDGRITRAEYEQAVAEPLVMRKRDDGQVIVGADYFAEDIRRDLAARFGEQALYKGGLVVRSTVDAHLQAHASKVLRDGLMSYDRRHGWRGPVTRLPAGQGWQQRLAAVPYPQGAEPWTLAVVLALNEPNALIGFADGRTGTIPWIELRWARPWMKDQEVGPMPRKAGDVVQPGDVVLVEAGARTEEGKTLAAGQYSLRQIPKIEGALVAMDPHTGRVMAMVGGWAYGKSQFNRATQALRQPGSAYKPFVYLPALEHGYTPSSLVLDAPIALPQGPGLPLWRPKNYGGDFLGPTTLRVGIEKSRNLMTVRLAQAIGMNIVADYAQRFGIYDNLPRQLAMALGAGETTVLKLTAAYAQLVNGGKKITPTLIDRIQDRNGRTVFNHDKRFCDGCWPVQYSGQEMPMLPDLREQIIDPVTAYQMVSILEGVVQRGTGRAIASVNKPLAGKTGTSNDSYDVWFVGFSPDLAVGVFVGFDEPQSLGDKETGGSVAAPVFRDFMMEALKDKPATPFRVPPGVRMVRVNASTGKPAMPGEAKAILEAFKSTDRMPSEDEDVLEGEGAEGFTFNPLPTESGPSHGLVMPNAPPPPPTGPAPTSGGLY
ncbi:Penicillin-binding protein 1A (Includes: Penicillin-insensitive transglycosylase; Penicillin-sensitive transpeptidase) [Magnetospirillum sp. LM-5]|uniref:penicillin-binding protein 1A n=1 Tax=Magnetospirillum sp. LM-5 TaxID=2681466 RepID=UPI001382F5A1|nr:penicillin-binding protein 1A [Magnetospirillum sp. LM-5]CAA7617275.1 Penicillin-binding protein 1A (Includes: Penicillin-insensitive transglycosylase; Penicillin-sensitive transpeptidase) [Magnetospirillum sp. LM-5]